MVISQSLTSALIILAALEEFAETRVPPVSVHKDCKDQHVQKVSYDISSKKAKIYF